MNLNIEAKILNGFDRLSQALKSLLWDKAKLYGISPIQIQLLLFIAEHHQDLCNVSYLAQEFNLTKATVSDAVKVLLKKKYLDKDFSPQDKRRYNLLLSPSGRELVDDLFDYTAPLQGALSDFSQAELVSVYAFLSKFIFRLHQKEVIQVQRICFSCRHYRGDKKENHFCSLLNLDLEQQDIRLDCAEFEHKISA